VLVKSTHGIKDGLLNGIGGKFNQEDDINPINAMYRIFEESTGAKIAPQIELNQFADITGSGYIINLFRVFTNVIYQTCTKTDELVYHFNVKDVLQNNFADLSQDLKYLIPMALDKTLTHLWITRPL
jgi:hypothetical protein